MRRYTRLGVLLAVLGLLALGGYFAHIQLTSAGAAPNIKVYDPIKPGQHRLAAVPGEVIVKFKPDASQGARQGAIGAQGGTLGAPLGVAGYFLVTVKETDRDTVPKTVQALQKDPNILAAQPNYYRYSDATPNDPFYQYQWNLPKVQAPSAWDVSTGTAITVAVVDTGIAYENYAQYRQAPDLAGTAFVPGWNFINNNAYANDDNSHGTHVAGTIAQTTNNLTGTAGLAFHARLMPLKALNADGVGQDDWIASAIVWAADHGAKVINLSLGAPNASGILEDAVNYAHDKGAVVVAAAGNEGVGVLDYPAAYPNVIAVGSIRFDETRPTYANFGTGLALVAPGGDLTVDENNDGYPDGILQQTFDPNSRDPSDFSYWFFQGTSMATPHVSAVAALVLAAGTATTPDQVRQAMQMTAKDLGQPGWDPTNGWGLVQARAAIDWTQPPTPTPTPVPSSPVVITGVKFYPTNLASGDVMRVDIGVHNAGAITAQTQGPTPGFMYNEGDTPDSRGYADVAGRWRVGVDFASRSGGKDHPYRWGLGSDLAAGASVTVTGYIRLQTQRTSNYWVGLVQEKMRWWQDGVGVTGIAVGPPLHLAALRFAGSTATRYANVYQCTPDALLQRVWRVDYGRTTATYQNTRPLPAGSLCGSFNAVFGEYQLTVNGGTMTPQGWVTECSGSGGLRKVWRANLDGRNVPFQYPEITASCP